ncbi:MAG: helix-turn-helix domain-containing protein [Clostridia bacterium]|nr:helix-turn-helix domain-containing protein [Clostridia bacterium]
MNEEDDVKIIIAENLVRFRTKVGLTQLQLAEMLNYSDKAVSKWERAESVPDIRVLMQIAGIYNIKLDDLVTRPKEKEVKPVLHKTRKQILITALAVGLVWFIATGIFVLLCFIPEVEHQALVFLVATFVSSVVLMVFSAVWGGRVTNAIASSLILWTLAANIFVFMWLFTPQIQNLWLVFIAAAPFEVLIIIWFIFRKVK